VSVDGRTAADAAIAILDRADLEGRQPTVTERREVEALLKAAESTSRGAHRDVMRDLGRELGPGSYTASEHVYESPGAAFVKSDGYRRIRDPQARGETWSSGVVEVPLMAKGTLLEGPGSPGTGTGGGLVPAPQVVPGVAERLFQPLRFEDLILSGQTSSNTVRYAIEGTATSAAAGVAEGGTKPESTFAYSTADEPVKKIAHVTVISDELLEDAPAITAFINGRMALFCNLETERQLLRGAAGGNEVQGLLTSRGVPVFAGTVTDDKATQLFKAANSMRGSAFVEPEWIVIHPTDWQTVRLTKDGAGGTVGAYQGGGPFAGPYGAAPLVGSSNQLTGASDFIWGLPVYVSPIIGAGTALVGNRQGAQVHNRGGLRVESTNSHASHFVQDLVAIRAERRLALTTYRAQSFVEVRLA
jgi:HK97 family phage major capsid protein